MNLSKPVFLASSSDEASSQKKILEDKFGKNGFDKADVIVVLGGDGFMLEAIKSHMNEHANLIKPKFELAYSVLEKLPDECGTFSKPTGGYFIAFSTSKPIASKVVSLCEEIGVLITPAGSTFPNGNDPNNSIIRIAPTFVSEKELTDAMEVFITCVEVAHFDISI